MTSVRTRTVTPRAVERGIRTGCELAAARSEIGRGAERLAEAAGVAAGVADRQRQRLPTREAAELARPAGASVACRRAPS